MAGLISFPLVGASAVPASPSGIVDPSDAYNLNQYRLAMLPPTVDDVLRYNPGMSVDDATAYVNSEAGRLADQRQRASIARYGTVGNIPVNTSDAQLQQQIAAQKAGFRFPFSNSAALTRKVAGVAAGGLTVVTGWQIGTALGSAGLSFIGIDSTATVCDSGAAAIAPFIGAGDCSTFLAQQQDAANKDISSTAGLTAGPVTNGNVYGSSFDSGSFTGLIANPTQPDVPYAGFAFKNPHGVDPYGNSTTRRVSVMFAGKSAADGSTYYFSIDFRNDLVPSDPSTGKPLPGVDTSGNTWYATVNASDFSSPPLLGLCADQVVGCGDGSIAGLHPADQDPTRHLECDVLGSDGKSYAKTGPAFQETDSNIPAPQCPTLPDGVQPKHVTLVETGGPSPLTLYDGDQSPWSAEVAQKWPECTTGLCTLELKKGDQSCFDGKVDCDGWFDDPTKDQDYSCTYDGTKVTLDHCNEYRQTFAKDAITSGAPYSNGDGSFSLTPTTKSEAGSALAGAPTFDSCEQDSTSTGVFSVIFTPVRCALVWAFVPGPLVLQKQAADLGDAMEATDVGKWLVALPNFFARLTVQGCDGPAWTVGPPLLETPKTYHPFSACTGWQATAAGWTYLGSSAILLLFGLSSVLSSVSAVFGFAGFGRGSGGDGNEG